MFNTQDVIRLKIRVVVNSCTANILQNQNFHAVIPPMHYQQDICNTFITIPLPVIRKQACYYIFYNLLPFPVRLERYILYHAMCFAYIRLNC